MFLLIGSVLWFDNASSRERGRRSRRSYSCNENHQIRSLLRNTMIGGRDTRALSLYSAKQLLRLVITALFAGLFSLQPALAEETIQLSTLIEELLRVNPEIQAAGTRYEAALTRPDAARALPDPKASFGWMSAGTILPGGQLGTDPNANLGFQFSQEFPYPGKRGLKSDIAKKEAENIRQVVATTKRSRIAALKIAYYELAYVYNALQLLRENQDTLHSLSKVAEARYTVGKAMQQDLIRSGTEISLLENRILVMEQRKLTLAAEINVMLNRPAAAMLGAPQTITAPELPAFETYLAQAKENSPMLKGEQAMIESRDLEVQLAKKEFYPDLEVMTGYYYQGELDDMWEVRAEITLPIFRTRQKKQEQEAALNLTAAKQNYRVSEQMLEFRLRDAYVKAQTSLNLAQLYETKVVPQSRLALESSLSSYETGGVDFLTVLTNFTTIVEYRMNYYEQQAEYFKALATLEELCGTAREVEL